ncbi:MAG: OmpA family protein, partial [Pricia sp.]
IVELPFNSDAHSTAHPALNTDETKLYFASDREGSLGQSDIFVVDILKDGTFGTPKNLGTTVNTEARETFPFVTASGILYFASDGHPGLGGLDVFAVNLEDDNDQKVINLGKPVNGGQDDFSFIIDEQTKKGFFASNREGGMGSDDIYGFTETKSIEFLSKKLMEGLVIDEKTGAPLADATVKLYDSTGEVVGKTITDADGLFLFENSYANGKYRLEAAKDDFEAGSETSIVADDTDIKKIRIPLKKEMKKAPIGVDLIKYLNVKPIYFNLDNGDVRIDSSETLTRVIDYMKTFPDLKIKVQAHTDARGSASYNLKLSQKRAESTVSYLVENGIENSRILSEGFGETQLVNDCKTRESCTDEKHRENRRSEFMVIE